MPGSAEAVRCDWPGDDAEYQRYHDQEWGRPQLDDRTLFEKVCLEGFQSGLSWLTILRKRENFRAAFANFDFDEVARFGEADVERLLGDAGIIRHRGKITATINNAARAQELRAEFGSLAAYFWSWEPSVPEPHAGKDPWPHEVPGFTATSTAMAKDLKKRGWRFFGPTTAYAFMQAMGLVNDHSPTCEWREICAEERQALVVPTVDFEESGA